MAARQSSAEFDEQDPRWRDLLRLAGPLLAPLLRSATPVAVAEARAPGRPVLLSNAAFRAAAGLTSADVCAGELMLDAALGVTIPPALRGYTLTSLKAADGEDAYHVLTGSDVASEPGPPRATPDPTSRFDGASGAWEWSIADDTLYGDARFATLCGLNPRELADGVRGEAFFTGIHPEDRLRVRISVAAMFQGAEVFAREYRIESTDGATRWVSARGRSHLDEDDRPLRFTGVLSDITDQKRIEEQLHLAQRAGGVGTFLYESGFGTVEVTDEFCRLLGLQPSKVLPVRTINAVVFPKDPPIIGAVGPELIGELPYSEIRIRRADDGCERWLALRGQIRSEGGGQRFVGAIYDVTDPKHVQERLRQLNETLQDHVRERTRERDRVWNLSHDLINICDPRGVQKAVNPAWTSVLGYAAGDLVGAPFAAIVHPDEQEELRRIFADFADGANVRDFDLRLVAADGSWRSVNWTMTAEDDDIFCVGRDITVRMQLQDALRQSQKMEAVGQLTGGIAHDFNNMLTGVIGALDIIQRRIRNGRTTDLDRFIDAATNSAQRAAALTHRLLAFSRRQPLHSAPADVNALTLSMEELMRRTLGEQIELAIILDDDIPPVMIDANQLENAILNLALNARDAMEGKGRLSIRTRRAAPIDADASAPVGDYVCLTVSDTGEGMPPDVLAKAFDPFFTTKPIGQGTGLGLSMIYGFVKQSRGHIVIDSDVGRGTSVSLYLPVHHGAIAEIGAQSSTVTPIGACEQVLVVEDDPSVRLLVLDVLKELNYVGVEAADGPEALRILDTDIPIQLLVTDVGLPGLNGRQVAEIARQRRPDLPVLFMTGYSLEPMKRDALLDVGMDIISKPFSMEALAYAVQKILVPPVA